MGELVKSTGMIHMPFEQSIALQANDPSFSCQAVKSLYDAEGRRCLEVCRRRQDKRLGSKPDRKYYPKSPDSLGKDTH